jgi:uncharacterized surface protein with fasciclin (FAS1) repeats
VKKACLMLLVAVCAITTSSFSAKAQMQQMNDMNPMVGGAAMLRSRDIVDNAVNSADHTTLVAAVKAAGLVETLKSPGPLQCSRQRMLPSTNCRREQSKCWYVQTISNS